MNVETLGAFTSLLIMVLDLCPEFYIGGKEDLIWLPANEEHQRRCWLAPKPDVAADPVSEKMPKAVQAGLATTVAPAALSLRYAQTSPRQELSRTYATSRIAGFRQVMPSSNSPISLKPGILSPKPVVLNSRLQYLKPVRSPHASLTLALNKAKNA